MEDHSEVVAYPKDSMFIQDGNALLHTNIQRDYSPVPRSNAT